MKVIFGFNDIRQDGMGSAASTLMRALKAQGIDVQPVHAWKSIHIPGYIEEFNPRFVHDKDEELPMEQMIRPMIDAINGDRDVNVFSHFGSPNWACVIPFLRPDIRVVVSCHSVTPSALKIALAYGKRVSAYVPVSWEVEEKLLHKLSKNNHGKIHRIPNVVDVKRFPAKDAYTREGKIKIVFFGRIEDVTKGCDKIPHIAKSLKSRGLEFEWDFYGYFHWGFEERFYPMLEECGVADVINYKGCLNPEQIPAMLREYDIMVMPSNHEGCPCALQEAMCVGLPCVASRLHNVTDKVMEDGQEGYLAGKNDIEGFANAIYTLACDEQLREDVGRRARKKIIDQFSIERQGEGYKAVFEKVMATADYEMVAQPNLENYSQPNIVKPHILARVLPLWLKRFLKKHL